ncbi:hypothetical protein FH972_007006 [Carpinus fangiana]|uniref:Uncharacterized protein n=1 Tax=Carpinus fangiana TaxID=176857 RepID=A0A5N6QUB0_9ROSI|nr:hypothetical protein FH972_007006 [Carpinus fangiana]
MKSWIDFRIMGFVFQVCGQDEPAKKSPSDFKTPDRPRQNTPATDNSPLDSKSGGNITPKTPEAPLRDHGPFTRRPRIYEKEPPRKALFKGPDSPCESSSKYKTPVLSQPLRTMTTPATDSYRPLDSTSDGKAPSTHPQEATRKNRPHTRLRDNPEMPLKPRTLFK